MSFSAGRRIAGSSNFTCNVVLDQIGSGVQGYETLFHEGGHAAHLLNSEQIDVCFNHEYAPLSVSWAETQSMFLGSIFSSIEWQTRYAFDADGNGYPFDLYERKVRKMHPLIPVELYGIMFVINFEKEIYETKNLNSKKVIETAKRNYKKYFDKSEDSISVLNTPHIYSWESSASYHGYGLAELALTQWREYFYKKYGFIVDNPKVGKEMERVWKLGAAKNFSDFVVMATGKKLSPDAYLKEATLSVGKILSRARTKIKRIEKIKKFDKSVDLNAEIHMVHGQRKIAVNSKSFEDMAEKYKTWLKSGSK